MAQASVRTPPTTEPAFNAMRTLRRTVGWLAIAHVVLMLAGFSLQQVAPLTTSPGGVLSALAGQPLNRTYAGSFIALLSFLAFLMAATGTARMLRGTGAMAEWVASSIAATAGVFVAVTLAVGFSGATAAVYDAHNGADASTVASISAMHWFAVSVASGTLGLCTLLIAAGIGLTGTLPRWVAVAGAGTGVLCLVGAYPGIGSINDTSTMVWMVWFVAFGVAALRGRGAGARRSTLSAAGA